MSKMNLKKMTMAFAVAAGTPEVTTAPTAPAAKPAKAAKPIAAPNTESPRIEKKAKTVKIEKIKIEKTKAPKAPKAEKTKAPKAVKERDPNSLLSNNFRLYTAVGTTTFKGVTKIWFANETATRVKNMMKGGHVNVEYATLPKPMTKAEALEYLADNPGLLPVEETLAAELVTQKSEKLTNALRRQATATSDEE